MKRWRNWSGSVEARPATFVAPESLEALRAAVREAGAHGRTLRPVGSGHSFTPLCATDDTMVSMERFQGIESVDVEGRSATVRAGTMLRTIGRALAKVGLAMENLGDINRQALGGALATGTHGTGAAFGNLSTQATALTLVTADGEVLECSAEQEPETFRAAQVAFGSLGIIARVRLRLVPAFRLRCERTVLGLDEALAGLEAARTRHRHYEFFWFPHTERVVTKALDVTDSSEGGVGFGRALEDLLLENGLFYLASEACRLRPSLSPRVSQLSAKMVSARVDVGDSYRQFATPRLVRFQEMEYALPVERGPECLRELSAFVKRGAVPVHFPVEYRFVKGDDIPLSPAHGRDSAFIAVHQYRGMPLTPYFSAAEAIFRNHGGRPHWGKLHTQTAATLRSLYPRWDAFQAVRERLDPEGRFLNPHLRTLLVDGA